MLACRFIARLFISGNRRGRVACETLRRKLLSDISAGKVWLSLKIFWIDPAKTVEKVRVSLKGNSEEIHADEKNPFSQNDLVDLAWLEIN
jgi:hypothetical protein